MGHASRIWDVRFVKSEHVIAVLSFGEDSTSQVWQLTRDQSCLNVCQSNPLLLSHKHVYAYHSGKSIWASALVRRQNGTETVCAGGADGRIVQYDVLDEHGSTGRQAISSQCTMQHIALQLAESQKSCGDNSTPPGPIISKSLCEHVFDALGGTWIINREIKSALPTSPSGQFSGEARFDRRPPTALAFEKEYLYIESGKFITDQSLKFPATRRYVYRYQQASDSITAWFVKPDDNTAVDYLFHEIRLDDGNELGTHDSLPASCVVKASSYHLCGKDHYTPTYILQLAEGQLEQWKLVYGVKGPQKDYTAEAYYYKGRKIDDLKPNAENSAIPRSQKPNESISLDHLIKKDSLRSYVFLKDDSFLVTTAQGRVLVGTLLPSASNTPGYEQASLETTVKWRLVGQYDALKSSSIITRANGSDLILLGGNDGTMSFYDRSVDRILPMRHLKAKLAFLYALKLPDDHPEIQVHVVLAVCLGIPGAYVYKFSHNDHHGNDDTRPPTMLSLPAYFIVTSSCYLAEMRTWVLGSRNGVIAFYDESMSYHASMLEPCCVFTDIHGEEAITVIQSVPYRDGDQPSHVLTAGRDGHYAVHEIVVKSTSTLDEEPIVIPHTVHRSTPTFGPNIEGAAFDDQSQELIMWGFRSKEFVVWNATKDMETMSVDCGGAHRNWCYRPRKDEDGSNGGTFVWTKASVCHVHSQIEASHRLLSSGGHGREIKAMATSSILTKDNGAETQYIATGAEDTTIKIWSIGEQRDESKSTFHCLGTFTKHSTGIQQLRWSADGSLLFSAAGCEEFFVWRVQSVPFLGVGAVCEAICQRVTDDGDLRIMDFAITEISRYPGEDQNLTERGYIVTIVYSDSSIRLFRYPSPPSDRSLLLLGSSTYTTHCLTAASYLGPDTSNILCTASSDGHIAFWPIADSLRHVSAKRPHVSSTAAVHQNSIKSLFTIPLDPAGLDCLVITGGDDGALGITRCMLSKASTRPVTSTLLIPKAHAAAVNAVKYLLGTPPNKSSQTHVFVSSGNDQRIKTWIVQVATHDTPSNPTDGLSVRLHSDQHTSVADVSSLSAVNTAKGVGVVVAGIGMECFADLTSEILSSHSTTR
ncbi:MAG: hypothetical protein Q9192_007269 [Flavoplaca navasiana]